MGAAATGSVAGVTLPVTAALLLYHWGTLSGRLDARRWLNRAGRRRPAVAAVLAAVPGCAGGIAVSRLYAAGVVDRASLLAAHLATSGDASFVLLVGRPTVAVALFAFALVLGGTVGVLQWPRPMAVAADGDEPPTAGGTRPDGSPLLTVAWYATTIATGLLAAWRAAPALTGATAWLAIAASAALYRLRPAGALPVRGRWKTVARAAVAAATDAAEITVWVALADTLFELAQGYAAGTLRALLSGDRVAVAVAAALIGAIPGCGPQIFLARLFTSGNLPLAAIVANTVGQHGDAIFPLLARTRRTALWVTCVQAGIAVAVALAASQLLR